MLITGQAFAQALPDEVNHTQYLSIYQNLEQVLIQKTAEYERLTAEKGQIEKSIAQMEKDSYEIPLRNKEVEAIIISKRQEITRINSEIQALEAILGKVIEDLRRLDSIISQLQNDTNAESSRSQTIQLRRNQIAHDAAQINARYQRELRQELESERVLTRLADEMNIAQQNRHIQEREIIGLARDVNRYKVEINPTKKMILQNTTTLELKRPLLVDSQAKLPGIKSELTAALAKVSQIDTTLNPKKNKLNNLKAELARLSPDVARLNSENSALTSKIQANQAKINATNIDTMTIRLNELESEFSKDKELLQSNIQAQAGLQTIIKPIQDQIENLNKRLEAAQRPRGGNANEAAKLREQIKILNDSIANERLELANVTKEVQRLNGIVTPKQNEIIKLKDSIAKGTIQNATLQSEIISAGTKILENDKKITELAQSNANLGQQIAQLDQEVNALSTEREPLAKKAALLSQQETLLSAQIRLLTAEIQNLDDETKRLIVRLAEMEKTIAEYPQLVRRMENNLRQLDQNIAKTGFDLQREQLLLGRIRQDRETVEAELNRAQNILNQVGQDLENSERSISLLNSKMSEELRNRDALARYNQDSIKMLAPLKNQKTQAEKEIVNAPEEIRINYQDISTIAQELPKFRIDLNNLKPKVMSAEVARNTADRNASEADNQYRNRLSLYQSYLAQSQALGAEKASIGSTDGAKAGSVDAILKATKLASENAIVQGKWEALRRGYIRGEISGYRNGFDIGLASTQDADQGSEDGRVAGLRRAKDHTNLVVKPELYLAELERRLKEDTTSNKLLMNAVLKQEITTIKAMASQIRETVADLSPSEIAEASRILSSLDSLIAQSDIEIQEVLKLRKQLSDARNVYSAPGAGENANNVNCSAVYKNVKDFVNACNGSYVIRYQDLYNTSHAEAFKRDYGIKFKEQIESVYAAELNRLYPIYLKEASTVGREVGISSGKQETYQQNFNRAEAFAYNGALPNEMARVESEALNMVQDHLNKNSALTLKGSAKLSPESAYSFSPGTEADLKMVIKNIGAQASSGNSLVKITELSSNLSVNRREAPLTTVAGRSHSDLKVLKVSVDDNASPGSRAVIAGEIVHPGNDYRSSRIEFFRIEATLGINPSIDSSVDFDTTPDIATLFVVKKHNIDLTIKPQFNGVSSGYEAVLEEVGTKLVEIIARPAASEVIGRGVPTKLSFTYKLSKAAKGKTITLRLSVRNAGKIVSSQDLSLKAQ